MQVETIFLSSVPRLGNDHPHTQDTLQHEHLITGHGSPPSCSSCQLSFCAIAIFPHWPVESSARVLLSQRPGANESSARVLLPQGSWCLLSPVPGLSSLKRQLYPVPSRAQLPLGQWSPVPGLSSLTGRLSPGQWSPVPGLSSLTGRLSPVPGRAQLPHGPVGYLPL